MNGVTISMTPSAPRSAIEQLRSLHDARRSLHGALIAFGILAAVWMLDFRTTEDNDLSIFLRIYLGIYATAFGAFLLLDSDERPRIPGLTPFLGSVALFVLVAFSTGLFSGQTLPQMFALATPSFIYISSAYATARMVTTTNPSTMRKLLAVICVGYVISGVVVQRLIGGEIDFATIRYQILTGATVPALGYLECLLLFGLTVTEWAALTGGFLVVFLSVTRTYLIAALVQFAGILPGVSRLISPRLLALALAGLLFIAGLMQYGAFGLDRWTERLYNTKTSRGGDVTLYSRESEWSYMTSAFLRGGRTMMVGNGLAAETVFYFPPEIGGGSSRSVGFGHNQHLSILFTGGLAGGGLLLFLQFLQGLQSVQLLMRLSRMRDRHSDTLFLAAWGALIIIGVIATTFFSSVLNNRSWSLWYGLGTGLFLGARARYMRDMVRGVVADAPGVAAMRKDNDPALPPAVARRRDVLEGKAEYVVAEPVIPPARVAAKTRSRAALLPPAVLRRRALLAGDEPQER